MTDKEDMSCKSTVVHLVSFFLQGLSTELDAEKRLALQEEKQALEAKLLEV